MQMFFHMERVTERVSVPRAAWVVFLVLSLPKNPRWNKAREYIPLYGRGEEILR